MRRFLKVEHRGFDHEDGFCLECSKGNAVKVISKRGNEYFKCSNKECKNIQLLVRNSIGNDFLTGDDILTTWAEAMTYDVGFK